jgi:hypothetical protein
MKLTQMALAQRRNVMMVVDNISLLGRNWHRVPPEAEVTVNATTGSKSVVDSSSFLMLPL